MECSGSIQLSDRFYEGGGVGRASPYAIEGTAAHYVLDACLKTNTDAEAYEGKFVHVVNGDAKAIFDKLPKKFDVDEMWSTNEQMIEVVEDMVWAVQACIDYVVAELAQRPGAILLTDLKLDMTWIGRNDMGGTLDVAIDEPFGDLLVLDYKHGKGVVVEVDDNEQLLYYAAGIWHKMGRGHKRIIIVIAQPRAEHEDGGIRVYEVTSEQIAQFVVDLKKAADATDVPNAPRRAGDWCRFCPAISICPEAKEKVQELAALDFSDAPPDVAAVVQLEDNEELAKLLDWVPIVDAWVKAIEGQGIRKLMAGQKVPGKKLVYKKGKRAWVRSEDEIVTEMVLTLGVDEGACYQPPKLKSPAQMEKVRKGAKAVVKGLAEMAHGGLTMVDESDKRPAVSPDEFPNDISAVGADFDEPVGDE